MNISYYKWLPILRGVVTLEEMNRYWTICDLADCHEALEIQAEIDNYYQKAYEEKAKAERK